MLVSTAILSTAAFAFMLLPGFAFLRALWKSAHGPIESSNFYHYMMWGLLFSAIIYHFAFSWFPHPDLMKICCWLIGEDKEHTQVFKEGTSLLWFSVYTTVAAWGLGILFGAVIVGIRLDVLSPQFRFKNDWYYLLTGKSARKKGKKLKRVQIEFMYETNSSLIIYQGTVENYKFKLGTLDYIQLSSVYRTSITQWEKPIDPQKNKQDIDEANCQPRFYNISPEDTVVFKMEDMKNIKLNYGYEDKPIFFLKRIYDWTKNKLKTPNVSTPMNENQESLSQSTE